MMPDKALVDVFGREAGVALRVKPLNLLGLGVRNRPAGAPRRSPNSKREDFSTFWASASELISSCATSFSTIPRRSSPSF